MTPSVTPAFVAPRVVVVSAFRDSAARIPGYVAQAEALDWPAGKLHFVCVEGDSQDDTRDALLDWEAHDDRVTLLRCDTGRPHYGAVIDPVRFQTLAQVFNTGLDYVAGDPAAEYFQFIPSDVRFPPDLLKRLVGWQKDVIAPLFWGPGGAQFYDIWGFTRLDGWDFAPWAPAQYHDILGREPVRMQTVGGAILLRRAVWEAGVRYTPEAVDRGLCDLARAADFTVWCDPTTHIEHR